ncbi:MAG: hypothetical protein ACXADY_26700 [Candidatus Hodarchaeales archaeon]|jgi:hypothetical protein
MPDERSTLIFHNGYIFDQKFNRQNNSGGNSVWTGLRIDVGRARLNNLVSNKELSKTVIFNTQFGSTQFHAALGKSGNTNGLTTSEIRDGTAWLTRNGTTGMTLHYTLNTANFASGDWIEIDWVAIGTW